jgi:hypothetical protein
MFERIRNLFSPYANLALAENDGERAALKNLDTYAFVNSVTAPLIGLLAYNSSPPAKLMAGLFTLLNSWGSMSAYETAIRVPARLAREATKVAQIACRMGLLNSIASLALIMGANPAGLASLADKVAIATSGLSLLSHLYLQYLL